MKAAVVAVAGVAIWTVSFTTVSAQEASTRIEATAQGAVRVVLPDGNAEVLEPELVAALNESVQGLTGASDAFGGRAGSERGANADGGAGEAASSQSADRPSGSDEPDTNGANPDVVGADTGQENEESVEYGTSQPDYNASLGNEEDFKAAALTDPQEATAGGPSTQGLEGTGPVNGPQGQDTGQSAGGTDGQSFPGLVELVEDTVTDVEESADASPTRSRNRR